MIRVGINGFGRIGRAALRAAFGRNDIQVVAMNDLGAPATLAHLLKYDSVFRTWEHTVGATDHALIIDGVQIPVSAEKDPAHIPWKVHKVDVVLECTGRFTKHAEAGMHLTSGAKAVVISAPSHDAPTYVMGVNHGLHKGTEQIVNNASCTTNSVAPVIAILHEALGVKKAMMSTIHSMTAEQNVVDALPPALHPDLRRARAASVNIIPTSTGASSATGKVVQGLEGRFDGIAFRVPTLDVSLSDITALVSKPTTVEEVNELFTLAAENPRWKGIVGVSAVPLVSSDFVGSSFSAIVDLALTRVTDHDLVKVVAWYDNEWAYAARLLDLAEHIGNNI